MLLSIYRRFRSLVYNVSQLNERLDGLERLHDRTLINQGYILDELQRSKPIHSLQDAEFKIFSQFGDDGIIHYLVTHIEIENRTFIEFGVENFRESGCRYLMVRENWSGFVMDGSEANMQNLRNSYFFWMYDLQAERAFVTRENVSSLLDRSGFERDLGILSIDIDGMDYWVASALRDWKPRILIMEYNAVFGPDRAITIPYDPEFNRTRAHHSNLYFGASLKALCHLTQTWGYALVGTNSAGNNAFFVRRDLINDKVKETPLSDAFTPSKFRESRDEHGRLTTISGKARLRAIAGLPVVNVETSEIEKLSFT
jgi:hypothetical protein